MLYNKYNLYKIYINLLIPFHSSDKVAKKMSIDDNCGDKLAANWKRVAELRKSGAGKYKVIGIDKFDGEDWVHAEYDSAEEALKTARELTRDAMSSASDASIATVYYAYAPSGKYLGGDTWHNQ